MYTQKNIFLRNCNRKKGYITSDRLANLDMK